MAARKRDWKPMTILVSPAEKKKIEKAAERCGQATGPWAREQLLAAERDLDKSGGRARR